MLVIFDSTLIRKSHYTYEFREMLRLFLIDDLIYHIPMATEEPSVIAGAAHAAKIIYRNGGFKIR